MKAVTVSMSALAKSWALHLLGGMILALSCNAQAAEPIAEPMNILFVFADDWGRLASAYGRLEPGGINDQTQTPHVDRLAEQGVLFRHAFVSSPSCTPCRSAVLSGQHFWRTGRGAILRGAQWDSSIPSYPLLLRDAGYHIGKTYKVWSPGHPVDAPYGGGAHSYQKAGGKFNGFSQHVTKRVAEGADKDAAKAELLNEVRRNFQDFLGARVDDRPFCYWFGPTNVHRSWTKGSGLALWGMDPEKLKGKMPPFLPDVAEVREDFNDYLGEIAALDAALGVLMEELEVSGLRSRTLIVVSGDHGPPGFPYGKCNLYDFGTAVPLVIAGPGVRGGRVVDDLVSLIDLAPTFLEAGAHVVPAVMSGRSLWPLLTATESGRVDSSRNAIFTGRERHVEMARAGYLPYPQRAIRTHDYLYIINFQPDRMPLGDHYDIGSSTSPSVEQLTHTTVVTIPDEDAGPTKAWIVTNRNQPDVRPYFDRAYGKRPREELYVLADDPHQVNNRAEDPALHTVKLELHQRLIEELERTGDPRMVDQGRYFESPPLAGQIPAGTPGAPVRKGAPIPATVP